MSYHKYLFSAFIPFVILFLSCSEPKKTYDDMEQYRAIGNIKFGVDSIEFEKQRDSLYSSIETTDSGVYSFGYFKFRSLDPIFYNGKLKEVSLSGYEYESTSDMLSDLKRIKTGLEEKYGAPLKEFEERGLSDGESGALYMWSIGRRTLIVGEGKNDNKYNIYMKSMDLDAFFPDDSIDDSINKEMKSTI